MNDSSAAILLKKITGRQTVIFFSLAIFTFLSCFITFRSVGLYGDDWGAASYLTSHSTIGALRGWIQWHGEIDNFRPLAGLSSVIWYWGYYWFGLSGVALSIWAAFSVLYYLTYVILSKFVSPLSAYFATILFILYPTNNFYLWQVTTIYPLSLILVFSAVLLYWRKQRPLAFLFYLAAALTNESTLFIFLLALLPAEKISFQDLKKSFFSWLKLSSVAIVLYAAVRVISEKIGWVKGGRLAYVLKTFNLLSYIAQFIKGLFIVLFVSWGFVAWKIFTSFKPSQLLAGLLAVALAYLIWIVLQKYPAVPTVRPPAWYLLVAGAVLVCAGRYYGFYYVPSINVLNLDSRYYFASSSGAVIFFAGLIETVVQSKVYKYKTFFTLLMFAIIFCLGVFKYEVQLDYVNAWTEAKNFWHQLITKVPALEPGETILVDFPDRTIGNLVSSGVAIGDLGVFVPGVYGQQTHGFVLSQIESSTTSGDQKCLDATPDITNLCVDQGKIYYFKWDGTTLLVFGNGNNLVARKTRQTTSGPVRVLLSQ